MPGRIQSIERAAAILRLLSAGAHAMGVAELASEMGLSRPTVHGLLRSLCKEGLVEQDPESRRYRLGAALLHMGSSYLDGNELRARSMNWADALAARTGATVRIGMLHGRNVLIVHHVFRPDDSVQSLEVGRLLPLQTSALGRALLAEHRCAAAVVSNGDRLNNGHDRGAELGRVLAVVRQQGWAGEVGELIAWEASIAAAIRDRRGTCVGAVGISGPITDLTESAKPREAMVEEVLRCAWAISRELGALPW